MKCLCRIEDHPMTCQTSETKQSNYCDKLRKNAITNDTIESTSAFDKKKAQKVSPANLNFTEGNPLVQLMNTREHIYISDIQLVIASFRVMTKTRLQTRK